MSRTLKTAASAAVLAAAGRFKPKTSEATLQNIRDKLRQVRDLQAEVDSLNERLAAKNAEINRIRLGELPSLYETAGIDVLGIEREGNLPGYDTELVPFYSASLPEDERREQAFKKFSWLRGLTKNKFTVDFGKGDAKKASALEKVLRKSKIEYSNKVSVHSGTLTAEVRRRFESGQPLPPADMTLLGAFAGKVVKFTKREED